MSLHITIVSCSGEPSLDSVDLLIYAGYFKEAAGKPINSRAIEYNVVTKSALTVKHVVLHDENINSDDVVFVVTGSNLVRPEAMAVVMDEVAVVVDEMCQRVGTLKSEADGPFSPDLAVLVNRPELQYQFAYRLDGCAKAMSDEIANGHRSAFHIVNKE